MNSTRPHRFRATTALAATVLAAATVTVTQVPAYAAADRAPVGAFETMRIDSGSVIRVTGWAVDPDVNGSITVAIYRGGVQVLEVTTDVSRPDIAKLYPGTGKVHGFDVPVVVFPGRSICVVAVNVVAGTPPAADTPLGCKSFGDATRRVSADPYGTATGSQNASTAEPDSYAFGDTIVAAFQTGRYTTGGGSDNIGVVVSQDAGISWTQAFLPGITTVAGGTHQRVSDPAVAYDRRHGTWLIVSLPVLPGADGEGALVSRSTDGARTWLAPVWAIPTSGQTWDKTWITCDNTTTSPYYGRCYVQAGGSGDHLYLATSTDGGATWAAAVQPAGAPVGTGGAMTVLPNGTVVAFHMYFGAAPTIRAVRSTNGGQSWNAATVVADATFRQTTLMRDLVPLPDAAVDANGRIHVVWEWCGLYGSACSRNDIMTATSTDGLTWTAPAAVARPEGNATHFMPTISADPTDIAHAGNIAVTFHSETDQNCTLNGDLLTPACTVSVMFQASRDGGATWGPAAPIAGPMQVRTMATAGGLGMLGDYTSTTVLRANAVAVFAGAAGPGTATPNLDQAMYAFGPISLDNTTFAFAASAGTGPVTSGTVTRCLSASGGSVQLRTCDGTSYQEWNHTGQTMRAMEQCLTITGTASGTPVAMAPCDGSGNQQWLRVAGESLWNAAANRCLHTPGTADGTVPLIWDCNGAVEQRWFHVTYDLGDTLGPGQQLNSRTYLRSQDGRFTLVLQADNNLVVYGPGMQALWATNVFTPAVRLVLRSTGDLAVLSGTGSVTWNTGTGGGNHLVMQNDGNLVLYTAAGQPVWSSGTCCH